MHTKYSPEDRDCEKGYSCLGGKGEGSQQHPHITVLMLISVNILDISCHVQENQLEGIPHIY